MKILFLDDMQRRHDAFKRAAIGHSVDHVFDAKSAIAALEKNEYDMIYLDHDLAAEQYEHGRDTSKDEDGCFVARSLRDMTQHHGKTVIVHSLNPIGRANIKSVLKDLYQVYMVENFVSLGELWKVDVTILGQALGLLPVAEKKEEA